EDLGQVGQRLTCAEKQPVPPAWSCPLPAERALRTEGPWPLEMVPGLSFSTGQEGLDPCQASNFCLEIKQWGKSAFLSGNVPTTAAQL
uniref:Uncharacterized protein n=1 Tax=Malurus cyaneus samueli TaxID=2593467 RepID=A0A8C5TXL9_9PASS